jgi:dethiobiotin synthetase
VDDLVARIEGPAKAGHHDRSSDAGRHDRSSDAGRHDSDADRFWIVEGAGGVLVPLNARELMIDLIGRLQLPVIVAARSGLGTINHTTLTLEALRSRQIAVAGVIMIGEPNAENRAAIERYARVRVLGELPILQPLDCDTLRARADHIQLDRA